MTFNEFNLITTPNSILRKVSEPSQMSLPDGLVDHMFHVMRQRGGVGLAAPQIGLSSRVFVAALHDGPMVFVNPSVSPVYDTRISAVEGCLSIPGTAVLVPRHNNVYVTAVTPEGEPIAREFFGMDARIIQHEFDHLNGVLITDY